MCVCVFYVYRKGEHDKHRFHVEHVKLMVKWWVRFLSNNIPNNKAPHSKERNECLLRRTMADHPSIEKFHIAFVKHENVMIMWRAKGGLFEWLDEKRFPTSVKFIT